MKKDRFERNLRRITESAVEEAQHEVGAFLDGLRIEARCPRCEARDRDWWKPEPEDPFWMLEAEDGEWLKNRESLLGTRDATKAIRFPTEQDAYNHPARMKAGSKWWSAKPTEHSWIVP